MQTENLTFPLFKMSEKEIELLLKVKTYFSMNRDIGFICYVLDRLIDCTSEAQQELKCGLKDKILLSFGGNVDSLGLYLSKQGLGNYTVTTKTYEEATQLREIWIEKLIEYNN